MSLMPRAKSIVLQHETAVKAIADELIRNGEISGSRAKRLFSAAEQGQTAMYGQSPAESATVSRIGQPAADHSVEIPRTGVRHPGGGYYGDHPGQYDPGEPHPGFTDACISRQIYNIIERNHEEELKTHTPERNRAAQQYLDDIPKMGREAAWRKANHLGGADDR